MYTHTHTRGRTNQRQSGMGVSSACAIIPIHTTQIVKTGLKYNSLQS